MAKVKKKIWSVVMPRSFTDIGAKELLCLLALHIYRVPLLLRLSYAVQEGDRVLFTRNVPAYWKAMRSFLQIAVEQTIVMSVSTYLKTCLNIKWRRKITKYLHKDYFEKNNYYHVESMLKDVDARMTDISMALSVFQFIGQTELTPEGTMQLAPHAPTYSDADPTANERVALVVLSCECPCLDRCNYSQVFSYCKSKKVTYDLYQNTGVLFLQLDLYQNQVSFLVVDKNARL